MDCESSGPTLQAKIVLLGEQNVGKSTFVVVFGSAGHQQRGCSLAISPTIGASFVTCQVAVEGVGVVRMQIVDTAGQERYRSMAPLYYRKADAAIIMYDLSSHPSFRAAQSWVTELKRHVEEPVLILLVGNKCDLTEMRAVSYDTGRSYAHSVGASFCETSALTYQGVREAFDQLAAKLISQHQACHSKFPYHLSDCSRVTLKEPPEVDGDLPHRCCTA